jgi:cobalt-zinc-cadmium resistance protein CzcA
MDQIRDTMITAVNGVPVRIRDVAVVTAGHQPRLGIAGQDDDDDIVQGTVLMRRGEQSMPTIQRVEAQATLDGSSVHQN